MHTIDFTTALALLLRDGARRDAFRDDANAAAQQLNICGADRFAFTQLSSSELEVQADVLMRKRLDRVKLFVPELLKLGASLWQEFREYARTQWQDDGRHDALQFCEHLLAKDMRILSRSELERLRFRASAQRVQINFIREPHVDIRGRNKIQILRRGRKGRVRETWLYLAF